MCSEGGQGTEMAPMEANFDQQLVGLAHKPLFQVFLDFRKAYDSLDRGLMPQGPARVWNGAGPIPNHHVILRTVEDYAKDG